MAEGGSVCVCVCVEVCVPFNVRSGLSITVCVLIDMHLFYYAFQPGRGWVVREYSYACGVAAELLAALKFSGGKDAGKHASEDVEGGWAAGSKANNKGLALVSVRHSFRLGDGVEHVGLAVGLAEAGEVVEVQHLDAVFSVKPEDLVSWGDAVLLVTADAP